MTTAVQSKPATAPAPSKTSRIISQGLIPIVSITVKEQVRKKFDENAHKELTKSIRTKGVISPVTLRPLTAGKFELVAGERRYRAAKAAGLAEIPAIVRDLTDQDAALYQVEENIHRKDLTPIEEARGFKLLLEAKKFTVEQLAQLVDKSLPYVYRAVNLLELPKLALEKIEAGILTPAHGHQFLRVPPFEREALVKEVLEDGYDGRVMTATELREQIDSVMSSNLAAAKFPKDKPYAGMSACNGCPSNTANQTALFDEAVKGTCTNKTCFTTKTGQLKKDFFDKIKLAHLGAAFVEYGKGWIAEGHKRRGGYVVKEELNAKNAKGLYGVIIDSEQKVWLCTQPKGKKPGDNEAADASPNFDWERENTGKRAASRAEVVAILAALKGKKLTQDAKALALNEALQDVEQSLVVEAWANPKNAGEVIKIEAEDLQKILFVAAIKQHDGIDPAHVKFLGIDIKKIRAKAKKEALADYDVKLTATKSEKKA